MRPTRVRLTIRGLMLMILFASLGLGVVVAVRARRERLIAIEHARADHQHAVADRARTEALLAHFREQLADELARIQQAESSLNDAKQRFDRLKRDGEHANVASERMASAVSAVDDAQSQVDRLRAWNSSFAGRQKTLNFFSEEAKRARAIEAKHAETLRQLTGTTP